MPEFILDLGAPEAARAYAALDEFTQGYIEAMFFTDASDPDDGDLEHATFAELARSTRRQIIVDSAAFQKQHLEDLDEAIDNGRINGYDLKAAGRDFWYTRNHHGVGFWDRSLGDVGDKLTEAAHAFGEVSLYRGDDGLIYLT